MSLGVPIQSSDQFNAATYFIDRHLQEGRGEKIAIECEGRRVSYQKLWEDVNRFGNGLRELGVRIEERILLLLLDGPEFAVSFFGAIKIGAVPVPVNTLLKPVDYQYILNNSRARVAVVSDSLYPQIEAIPRKSAPLSETHHRGGSEITCWQFELRRSTRAELRDLEAEPTSKDDAAFWLYSSGSTGVPKACVHLQHDMVVCAERYAKGILGMTENDRCFSVAKLFFAYGLGNALYFPLAVGGTSILWPGPPKPQRYSKSSSATGRHCSSPCPRTMQVYWPAKLARCSGGQPPRSLICLRSAMASLPEKPCPRQSSIVSKNVSESRSWTRLAQPKFCTYLSPIALGQSGRAPVARLSQASRRRS